MWSFNSRAQWEGSERRNRGRDLISVQDLRCWKPGLKHSTVAALAVSTALSLTELVFTGHIQAWPPYLFPAGGHFDGVTMPCKMWPILWTTLDFKGCQGGRWACRVENKFPASPVVPPIFCTFESRAEVLPLLLSWCHGSDPSGQKVWGWGPGLARRSPGDSCVQPRLRTTGLCSMCFSCSSKCDLS